MFYTYDNTNYLFGYVGNETQLILPSDYNGQGYEIYQYAFYKCKLTSITIPDSVTSIGNYAFYGFSGLTEIRYNGDLAGWLNISGLDNLMKYGESAKALYVDGTKIEGELVIPDSVTSIASYAFSGCSGLTRVTIPDSVTSIGDYTFSVCSGLTSVTIGNGVTSIGDYTFSGCSGLTSVTIPDSVTSIGEKAFCKCKLTSIKIPDSVTSIGFGAFSGCSGLTSVTIGNAVNSIGKSAFYDCSNLTSVKIPDSVTSIGSSAFSGCTGLTSVTIGNGVTSIGDSAFYNCGSLKKVFYKGTVEQWSQIAIERYNTNLTSATRYYYSDAEPDLTSDGTAYNGNYWHYDTDGTTIIIWKKEI